MDWRAQLRAMMGPGPDFDQVFDASDEEEKRVASQMMLDFRGNRRAPPDTTWIENLQALWGGFTGAQALPEVWDTQHGIRDADALYRGPQGPAAAVPKMQAAPNTLYPQGEAAHRAGGVLNQFAGPPAPPSAQERERLLLDLLSRKTGLRT